MVTTCILQVALPLPLPQCFDYLPPSNVPQRMLTVGLRVRVAFGTRRCIGLILGISNHSEFDLSRLKRVIELIDPVPLFDKELLDLLTWASDYYRYPIGEVVSTALPARLRRGSKVEFRGVETWCITPRGREAELELMQSAPRQAALLKLLRAHGTCLDASRLNALQTHWRPAARKLVAKGLVEIRNKNCLQSRTSSSNIAVRLNSHQQEAVAAIARRMAKFGVYLLDGVTGSGKTEVYLALIEMALQTGHQALILVPEIGLTPQLLTRFARRLSAPLAVLHSGLSDSERHCAWYSAREGHALLVLGTRSAIFTPLAKPGIIIVDEEHDSSFKQQDGFRYHARDLAVYRAKQLNIPVLLGSATPSLESLYNVGQGKYRHLSLPERAGKAKHPILEVIDVRRRPMVDGLSDVLLGQIRKHLQTEGQVLLFLNRRGYAPVLICHQCGWVAQCRRCDASMTLHAGSRTLRCHHCGSQCDVPEICPECESEDLRTIGQGTERVEHALKHEFADVSMVRIDRDTVRRKGSMEAKLTEIRRGYHRILIGTQMLSKGHDFPDITLVGILNVDQGLFSTDFRAMERMAQLIVQVSGRAGRANKPGKVLLQTHKPDHPLLRILLTGGYAAFCAASLRERQLAELPPYRHMAMLRAEATNRTAPAAFLDSVCAHGSCKTAAGIVVMGPVPAPMERRAGRYRAQLLFIARHRKNLNELFKRLSVVLYQSRGLRRVRWSLDVDPVDLS